MTDKTIKTQLRMPSELQEQLRGVSELSGRSMNAEIVHRLEGSLAGRLGVVLPEALMADLERESARMKVSVETLIQWRLEHEAKRVSVEISNRTRAIAQYAKQRTENLKLISQIDDELKTLEERKEAGSEEERSKEAEILNEIRAAIQVEVDRTTHMLLMSLKYYRKQKKAEKSGEK